MKHVTLIGMLAVVLVAALAVPAQAVIIHRADWSGNITSTRFFDNFEDGAHNSYSTANIGAWSGAPKVSTTQEAVHFYRSRAINSVHKIPTCKTIWFPPK